MTRLSPEASSSTVLDRKGCTGAGAVTGGSWASTGLWRSMVPNHWGRGSSAVEASKIERKNTKGIASKGCSMKTNPKQLEDTPNKMEKNI